VTGGTPPGKLPRGAQALRAGKTAPAATEKMPEALVRFDETICRPCKLGDHAGLEHAGSGPQCR